MNNINQQIIPDLRFPEFVNEEDWNVKELRKIGKTISGLTGKSGDDFGSGKPYVTYKQVFGNSSVNFSECLRVNIGDDENQNVIKKGDVLFTTSSETPDEVAFASVVIETPKEPTYLNSFCFIYRPENLNNTDPEFSRYIFRSNIFRKLVGVLGQGSTRFNISKGAFLDVILPFPNSKEQKKIASCLSSLDELITAQKEKLELLKNHKKGLMQNIFPQEGETVPKFRFPKFENDGDWDNISLENLCKVITKGTTPTSLGFSYVDYGVNFIKIESILDGKINLKKAAFITYECNDVLKRSQLKENDILLSIAGALGVVTTVNKNILPANTNQALSIIRLHNENQKDYLKAFLKSNQISKEINKIKAGAAQPNISLNQVQNFRILIPRNLIEQQKIASVLSSLDELISSQTDKIEELQIHKKGLMQGLFPKMID